MERILKNVDREIPNTYSLSLVLMEFYVMSRSLTNFSVIANKCTSYF